MAIPYTHDQLAEIMRLGARELAATSDAVVLMAELIEPADVKATGAGWATIGRIDDALGRCWWSVAYCPESGDFRFVRHAPATRDEFIEPRRER